MSDSAVQESPPKHDDMTFTTTPNLLTLARMGFVPIVVLCLMMRDPRWDIVGAGLKRLRPSKKNFARMQGHVFPTLAWMRF